jgi:hypothetical protein
LPYIVYASLLRLGQYVKEPLTLLG